MNGDMHASTLVTVGMTVLPVVVVAAVVTGVVAAAGRRAGLLVAVGLVAWMGVLALLAHRGVLARFDARPPPLFVALVVTIGLAVALARSSLGAKLAELPIAALVGVHAFRLPLELVMHEAAAQGIMPVQMSFSGWNFDIVTGVTAIVVALLAARGVASRRLIWAWNLLGSVLLAVVATIGVTSTPMLHAFGEAPGRLNTWIAYLPFVWLPGVLVAVALAGHIILWRRLASPRVATAIQPDAQDVPAG